MVVVAASVLTRLAAGGATPTPAQQRIAAKAFFALQVVYSLGSVLLYLYLLKRSPCLAAAASMAPHAGGGGTAGAALGGGDGALGGRDGARTCTWPCNVSSHRSRSSTSCCTGSGGTDDGGTGSIISRSRGLGRSGLSARLRALSTAGRAASLPAACQLLCFSVTLASWPSIPGAACVEGAFHELGQGWWFQLVVATYNGLDLISRLNLTRLEGLAKRFSPRGLLYACLARLLLPPLIYICVRPRLVTGGGGNILILALVAVLALSNGLLATASMMQVRSLPITSSYASHSISLS